MAVLNVDVDFRSKEWLKLGNSRKDMALPLLYDIGKRARYIAKQRYLSGQEIDLFHNGRGMATKDKTGVYLVTSAVGKNVDSTLIKSRTMNLFERGRTLANGRRELGHYVITVKLKLDMDAKMLSYGKHFEQNVLAKKVRAIWK